MIFIVLSVIQSTLIFVTFRLFNNFRIDNWQAITVNYIVATIFGFLIFEDPYSAGTILNSDWFFSSLLLGGLFIGTFYVFALSSQKVGVALTSVASKMSVIIPVVFGMILYDEDMGLMKATGILLALLAFYLTFKKKEKNRLSWALLAYPLLMFLGNGFNDTIMKYTEHHYIHNDLILYLAVVFLTGFVIGMMVLLPRLISGRTKLQAKNMAAGTILGLFNFGSTYYILKAMGVFESSVVFPLTNSAIVMLSALTGYIVFKEKLRPVNWAGVGISILAILIIANS